MTVRTRLAFWAVVAICGFALVVPLLVGVATWLDSRSDTAVKGFEPTTGAAVAPGTFADVTAASGVTAVPRGATTSYEGRARYTYSVTGQAWGDYDRDGHLDLYLTSQVGPNALYRGEPGGRFAVSPLSGAVALPEDTSGGAVFADYDNDGWPDLYVTSFGRDTLFHNDAGAGFTDVTDRAGIFDAGHGTTAAWADYDRDGNLDLYVANYGCFGCDAPTLDQGHPDRLYHNDGDGTFTDATAALPGTAHHGWGFVAGWLDHDDDGDADLYLVNDVRGTAYLPASALYRNDGPGCGGPGMEAGGAGGAGKTRGMEAGGAGGAGKTWCFTDVSAASGTDVRMDGMGLAVGDYDGDLRLDLYATNTGWSFAPLTGPAVLLRNAGAGAFTDVSRASGADVDALGWGTVFLDYDNDGWQDLYVALGGDPERVGDHVRQNRLLHNQGDGTFDDASAGSGANRVIDSFGVASADYNGDGWTDFVVGNIHRGYHLYANTGSSGAGNHRLAVRLEGGGPVNRDAVGARVYATTPDGRTQLREIMAGSSLGAGNDLALGFGLGSATSVTLRVVWPDGTEQTFPDVPADVSWTLTYRAAPVIAALAPVAIPAAPPAPAGPPTLGILEPGALLIPVLTVAASLGLGGWLLARRLRWRPTVRALAATMILGAVAFQVLHCAEHLLQFGYWVAHPADQPWITPWGRVATDGFAALAGHQHGGRASGTELLHLTGNWIFLAGLIVLRRVLRDWGARPEATRAARFAFWLQLVHVAEHASLSASYFAFGTPLGISTLFGASFLLPGAWAPSIRLTFHFGMNAVVTVAALLALRELWAVRRDRPPPSAGDPRQPTDDPVPVGAAP